MQFFDGPLSLRPPRVQYFFNAPEFSAPCVLERRFELTNAATQKSSQEAIEHDVQDYRDTNREIKLLVGHERLLFSVSRLVFILSWRATDATLNRSGRVRV